MVSLQGRRRGGVSGRSCAWSPRPRMRGDISQRPPWVKRDTFSYRDIEQLMAARGLMLTYEAVRYWCSKFGAVLCQPDPMPTAQI